MDPPPGGGSHSMQKEHQLAVPTGSDNNITKMFRINHFKGRMPNNGQIKKKIHAHCPTITIKKYGNYANS